MSASNLFLECKECKKEISISKEDYSQCPECKSNKFYIFRKRSNGTRCFNNKYCPNHPNKLIPINDDKCYENVCCKECLKEIKSVVVDDMNSPARINWDMCNECGKGYRVWSPDNALPEELEAKKQKLKNEDRWCSCHASNQIKSNQTHSSDMQNSDKSNYLPWILGGVGLVGLIGMVIYFLMRKENK